MRNKRNFVKKLLSIILCLTMVLSCVPMTAQAAYDYDEENKFSFRITNLVMEWNGERYEWGTSGSAFYEQSLTKISDGEFQYKFKAALSTNGGTWWSDFHTIIFDGVNCDVDYLKTFDLTDSTSVGGHTMTWTYTVEVSKKKGHVYDSWTDNGDGNHSRTCKVCGYVDAVEHNWVAATCMKAKYCKDCGVTEGEPVADAHKWGEYTTNNDGTHTRICAHNSEHIDKQDCIYSDATCTELAKCSLCNHAIGDYAKDNHSSDQFKYEQDNENEHKKYYACCEEYIGLEGHSYNAKNGTCNDCDYQCLHSSYTDGVCDACGYSCRHNIVDNDCSICGKQGIQYLHKEWDDSTHTMIEYIGIAPANATVVTSSTTTMSNGWYIVYGDVTVSSRINISETVHLILADGATLNAEKGIKLHTGNTLYIYGQSESANVGCLNASAPSNVYHAGIGGSDGNSTATSYDPGNLVINGGNITATGGSDGAGLGTTLCGMNSSAFLITINGGRVSATGGGSGAGIGGNSSGVVTINGGSVTATSGNNMGAGIGGCYNKDGGAVTINGGTVTANGGSKAAGIGGGYRRKGGTVVITGGNVKATGYQAIGAGKNNSNNGILKDANGNNLTLNTITLNGASANTSVTDITGVSYGINGVKTLDDNMLYFYLPASAYVDTITAGGFEYICNRNNTFYTEHLEFEEANCLFPSTCTDCGTTIGETTEHSFVDGICSICGQDENGHFYIGTAKQLMGFAEYVNRGNVNANATLNADIDLTGYEWNTICETGLYYNAYGEDLGYAGTFDGNGHVIKNLTVTSSAVMDASCGLFGTVSGTIKNLGVEGFTFVDGGRDIRAGAIVGQLITTNGRVENCYVKNATITPGEHVTGGIAGCVYDGTIENCYVVESNITGTANRYGYIVGDTKADSGDRPGTLRNCYTDGTVLYSTNSIQLGNVDTATVLNKDAAAFASGEIAYLLNGSTSDGDLVWYQTLTEQAYPQFEGSIVRYNEETGTYNNHVHSWNYSVSADNTRIIATCAADDCTNPDGGFIRFSTSAIYNGETAEMEVENLLTTEAEISVTYTGEDLAEGGKPVRAGSYMVHMMVAETEIELPFTVEPKEISVTAVEIDEKAYDGTIDAEIRNIVLEGIIEGDEVTAAGTALFADKNAGTDKEVNITNIILDGADAKNYELQNTDFTVSHGVIHAVVPDVNGVTATIPANSTDLADVEFTGISVEGTFSPEEGQTLVLGENTVRYTFEPADTQNFTVITGEVLVTVTDTIVPVIQGITDGDTYYTTQKFNVTDDNLDKVTINGVDASVFELQGDVDAQYVVTAVDRVGNSVTVTVSMKAIAAVEEAVTDLTVENVTAEDKEVIQEVKENLKNIDTTDATDEEKEKIAEAIENCEELLEAIENLVTPTPTETEAPDPTEEVTPTPTETEAPDPTETEIPQPTEEPTGTPEVKEDVTKVFDDVYEDWYTDYVQYVYDNGLMTGIKGTQHFEPNSNITKAQVAQVLYNMEGQPEVDLGSAKAFKELGDVYTGEWYAAAVAWAYETGVVTGDLVEMKFFPNADVTREQLALMMYRYASYKKYDVTATSDFAGLVNADKIANWSIEGVRWAVGAGLISGIEKDGVKYLAPQGNASRAQVTAILQRFCENVAE